MNLNSLIIRTKFKYQGHYVISIQVDDFDRMDIIFPSWLGRYEQLSRGPFAGVLQQTRGKQLLANNIKVNQIIHVQGCEQIPVITIAPIDLNNAGSRWQGRYLDAGKILVRGINAPVDHCTMKGAVYQQFIMLESHFRDAMVQEVGYDPGPLSWHPTSTSPALFQQLNQAIRYYLNHADDATDAEIAELEERCVRLAIEAVFPEIQLQIESGFKPSARTQLVKRVEEYLRHNLHQAVTEGMLCREFNIRGRTLRLAFHEELGMGPLAYLQLLRLNTARTLLKDSRMQEVPVAAIARQVGYLHSGRFSSYYLRTFGESPRQTRR